MSMTQAAALLGSEGAADSNGGIGFLGFAVIAALALALVFLYRSMRRQLGRIDFDAEGESDAERMRGGGSSDGDPTP